MAYPFVERVWLGIGIALTLGYPVAARGEVAGKAVSVSGKVLVRNENAGKVETKFLQPGDSVEGGTVINTDSVGAVKLLLNDKSIIDLGPSTLFKVNHFKAPDGLADRDVAMTMAYGKVRASVNTPVSAKGKYQIRTRSVTMGVRGTEFVVLSDLASFTSPNAPTAADPAPATVQTQVTVVHGKVVVEDDKAPKEQKPVALTAGEQLTKKEADKPDDGSRTPASEQPKDEVVVKKLEKEEVAQVKQEAKQEDRTFVRAVVVDSNNHGSGGDTMKILEGDFNAGVLPAADFTQNMPSLLPMAGGMNMNGMPITLRVVFKK